MQVKMNVINNAMSKPDMDILCHSIG